MACWTSHDGTESPRHGGRHQDRPRSQTRRRLPIALIRIVLLAAVAATAVFFAPAASAQAATITCSSSLQYVPNVPPRCEQWRYARETVWMSYTDFQNRKTDFSIQGCNADQPQARGCQKPPPYNAFDWTSDGCSGPTGWLPPAGAWSSIFNGPCQLHDFGYRNFGKGLRLQRSEARRRWVDYRFGKEMFRVCSTWSNRPDKIACYQAARTMYRAVTAWPLNYWLF